MNSHDDDAEPCQHITIATSHNHHIPNSQHHCTLRSPYYTSDDTPSSQDGQPHAIRSLQSRERSERPRPSQLLRHRRKNEYAASLTPFILHIFPIFRFYLLCRPANKHQPQPEIIRRLLIRPTSSPKKAFVV